MTSSRHFSRSVKRAAYKRANGRCENSTCGIALPAGWGGINYDHIIGWALSQDSSLENCQCLCAACHLDKTAGYDTPVTAKVLRIADARIGIRREGKKLPAGRTSGIKKKLSGEVVPRPERGAAHRELMAKLHGEQAG